MLPEQSQAPSKIPSPPHTPHSSKILPAQSQAFSEIPPPLQIPHSSYSPIQLSS